MKFFFFIFSYGFMTIFIFKSLKNNVFENINTDRAKSKQCLVKVNWWWWWPWWSENEMENRKFFKYTQIHTHTTRLDVCVWLTIFMLMWPPSPPPTPPQPDDQQKTLNIRNLGFYFILFHYYCINNHHEFCFFS